MQIHESSEDYLESILMLKERKGFVRSIDIANELDYTKASVSIAMKKLRENGYIEVDADGFFTLTPAGHKISNTCRSRHRTPPSPPLHAEPPVNIMSGRGTYLPLPFLLPGGILPQFF